MGTSDFENYLVELESNKIETLISNSINETNLFINKFTVNKNFKIFHTNIRSLAMNFDELEIFLSRIQNGFDVIVLTESWNITNLDNFTLEGYVNYYNNSTFNQNDGVVVFLRKEHVHSVIKVEYKNNLKIARIELTYNNLKIGIAAIYKPPSYDV